MQDVVIAVQKLAVFCISSQMVFNFYQAFTKVIDLLEMFTWYPKWKFVS